ncbi:cea8a281-c326-4456-afdf-3a16c39a6fcc [Thermothielavioides terrestris]|uniref:Cea8a281-c326-4456-afdf-3a16c39a6fcc n=1 Tax=Thermothielavioides terrestris TaxID=2587410 RepID=A0A3S4B2W5_9PEZI|nr:cea8a281-c326-4456-afdf-3a16c39a6fcc [Thermothielavioides terrestris]
MSQPGEAASSKLIVVLSRIETTLEALDSRLQALENSWPTLTNGANGVETSSDTNSARIKWTTHTGFVTKHRVNPDGKKELQEIVVEKGELLALLARVSSPCLNRDRDWLLIDRERGQKSFSFPFTELRAYRDVLRFISGETGPVDDELLDAEAKGEQDSECVILDPEAFALNTAEGTTTQSSVRCYCTVCTNSWTTASILENPRYLLLAPTRVEGFHLRTKKWVTLPIRELCLSPESENADAMDTAYLGKARTSSLKNKLASYFAKRARVLRMVEADDLLKAREPADMARNALIADKLEQFRGVMIFLSSPLAELDHALVPYVQQIKFFLNPERVRNVFCLYLDQLDKDFAESRDELADWVEEAVAKLQLSGTEVREIYHGAVEQAKTERRKLALKDLISAYTTKTGRPSEWDFVTDTTLYGSDQNGFLVYLRSAS